MKSKIFGLLATGLVAVLTACPPPVVVDPTIAISGSDSLLAGAAVATFTATANPATTAGTIEWTLTPASGSGTLSATTSVLANGVATVGYTPPATVTATLPVTLKGTLQGKTFFGSKTFNVTSPQATGINVAGKVLKWSGKPEGGVNIIIIGANGLICKDPVSQAQPVSAPDGTFSCNNVVAPYQLTAVPVNGTSITPLSYDNVSINNPIVVVRKNSFAASTNPGFDNECTPVPNDGILRVKLNQDVPATRTGEVVYIAPGIDYEPTRSYASLSLAGGAGVNTFTINVPFDKDMCYDDLIGSVVYIERSAGGTIIAKGGRSDIRIFPGQTTALDSTPNNFPILEVTTSNSATMSGTATFPSGLITQFVTTYLRVEYTIPLGKLSKIAPEINLGKRTAYFPLSSKPISNTSTSTAWDLPTEVYASSVKVSYRAGFEGFAAGGNKYTAAWSDVVEPGASNIALNAPSISGTQQPNGQLQLPATSPLRAPNGNLIPDFLVASIQNTGCSEGNNFLNNYVAGFEQGTSQWLGNTFDPTVRLPDTNEPARIGFNVTYDGYALNGLCVREATQTTSADKILDGRAIQRNFYTDAALREPDVIRSAVWNVENNTFRYIP
jgi:hypothetical protein